MKMATTANYGNIKYESLVLEEEESLLAEDLAHFGNVRNEFVIFGKLASYGLLREGRLEESIQVCTQVLAIDPRNEEMNRLKERLTRFQNTANGSQLLKEEFIKQHTESPIRKLRRSVSEIKSKKFNSFENGASVNGATVSDGAENCHRSDLSKMRHTITNGTAATSTTSVAIPEEAKGGTPGSTKLGRSQSLGTRRAKSTSVLQKIQQFEQAAESRNYTSNPRLERRASRKPSEDTVMEGEVVIHSRPDSGFQSRQSSMVEVEPIQSVFIKKEPKSPISPRQFGTRDSQSQSQPQPQSLISPSPTSPVSRPAHLSFNLPTESKSLVESSHNRNGVHPEVAETMVEPPKSPTIVKRNYVTRKLSQQSETDELTNNASKVIITRQSRPGCNAEWTDHGTKIFSDAKIVQLEMEFFNSDLVMRGCILSPEGNILGLTAGFRIKHYEIQTLLTGMMDGSFVTSTRLTIGGIQFSCLSGTHAVVRGRIKTRGVNCTKCKSATTTSNSSSRLSNSSSITNGGGMTIVVVYEHPVLPKQIAMLVKSIGNILEDCEAN